MFKFFNLLTIYRPLLILVLYAASLCVQAESAEYRVKAAFMEKITDFINWPAISSVHDETVPFRVCVLGKNPFGGELQEMVNISRIKEKNTELVFLAGNGAAASGCDMLFIAHSKRQQLKQVLEQLDAGSVLTVSDTSNFASQGVMINLIFRDNRIRLEINTQAAQSANFKIGARLLKLASVVRSQ